jgi:hypothetical protein
VDGPYETAKEAKLSAESLLVVSDAKAGGLYVVSAAFPARAEAVVEEVARCLAARS